MLRPVVDESHIDRRKFLGTTTATFASTLMTLSTIGCSDRQKKPNILLITADDMDFQSLGVTGCKLPNITPHLDRLSREGVRFDHAHVTISVCQPSRQVLMTGRYPYNNGAMGFEPINENVLTLQESLSAAGYLNGIIGKHRHLEPSHKYCWDFVIQVSELGGGRDPAAFHAQTGNYIRKAKSAQKPFFLMVNTHDPHRLKGNNSKGMVPESGQRYKPKSVEVPGFLPDLPEIRFEIAEYYTAVHRADETVGQVLRALAECGEEENTLVMFLSDNGMDFPFSKCSCYRYSTRVPWIVRWPAKIAPGRVDSDHFITGIDFMPTLLEVAGLPPAEGIDGRSFLPLLMGDKQDDRVNAYTVFDKTKNGQRYPMRSVQNKRFQYIFNEWSNGKTGFQGAVNYTTTFRAMQNAGKTNKLVNNRTRHFLYRVKEELYDNEKDPFALSNLVDHPTYSRELSQMRATMSAIMRDTNDPLLPAFNRFIERKNNK